MRWYCYFQFLNNFNSLILTFKCRLRVYSGSQILIRFLTSVLGELLTNGRDVVELGCGTGCVGVVFGNGFLNLRSLLLTDGNPHAIEIARLNIKSIKSSRNDQIVSLPSSHVLMPVPSSCIIHCEEYLWSFSPKVSASVYKHFNDGKPYNIVLGCELIYYRTDIQLLMSTVMNLTGGDRGLFIHSHVFRVEAIQENFIRSMLTSHNWGTLYVPLHSFVINVELSEHADWYNVVQLISGPVTVINQLLEENIGWRPFLSYRKACEDNFCEKV